MRPRIAAPALVLTLLFAGSASANLIQNGSFEDGDFSPPSNQTMTLPPGATALAGWQIVNDSLAWIGTGNPWGLTAQDGDRFLDLSDYSAGPPFGGVQQSFASTTGYKYTVTFQFGSSTFWGRPAALTVSAAGQSETFQSEMSGGNDDWDEKSFVFVAMGSTTTLSFVGASGVDYIGLDNVDVAVSAVPEPASVMLMFSGLAALGLSRRRGS